MVAVVDSPGWLSILPFSERVSQELQRSLSLCGHQPDVVLLVLSVLSPIGPIQRDVMESHLRRLHFNIWERAIIIFTHTEGLGQLTIQDHIRRAGRSLQCLLDHCGNRYHVVQTHHRYGTPQSEVQQLFMKMQRVIETTRHPVQGYVNWGMDRRLERSMQGNQEQTEMRRRPNLRNDYHLRDGGTDLSLEPRLWRSAAPRQLPRVFSSRQSTSKPPLSIILLGQRKSGKSSVGNCVLDKKQFKTDTKTSWSTVGQGLVSGSSVTVVDTPGWSLYGQAKSEKVIKEIQQSRSLCSFGSKCVFLLVIPIDSFTEKHRAKVEKYLGVLGDDIWGKMLVLFTFGDDLKGKSIEKYITKQGPSLQWVMERCGYRHQVIETSVRCEDQREQLMEKIWGIRSEDWRCNSSSHR
ncbi:uncharacterized protein LOC110161949 isoform X2 [Boleophthalmus pectinirostris]|uniref:uncharacterized protein LOC110161949 isoform X2 n=1 Tax=Boleophthalmus pectinirostris TaxID=150288 RepID=UPI00242AF4AB|nr:uncharacterized protein LOC110161949 isoform X2 [Boleophthalmus pectinirostris]